MLSCGQNHHITAKNESSTASVEAIDDIIVVSGAGAKSSIDVSSNDTPFNCSPIVYNIVTQDNVLVTGSGPSYTLTPIAVGAWSFEYTATCPNGTADQASVSGNAILVPLTSVVGGQQAGPIGDLNAKIGRIGSFSDNGTYNDICPPPGNREIKWTVKVNDNDVGIINYQLVNTPIVIAGVNATSTHGNLVVDDWETFLTAIGGIAPNLADRICIRNSIKNCDSIESLNDSNEVCFNTPTKQQIAYSGVDVNITAPPGATSMLIKAWGAGGAGQPFNSVTHDWEGGAGGFVEAIFPSQNGTVVVGEGGLTSSTTSTYGGGGAGGDACTTATGSSGGGLSGYFINGVVNQANALIVAAGGGGSGGGSGSGASGGGGAGRFLTGQNGTSGINPAWAIQGFGASQAAGGTGGFSNIAVYNGNGKTGSALTGGQGGDGITPSSTSCNGGGGGGSGYFGGGGGGNGINPPQPQYPYFDTGGGGGSGFLHASATSVITLDGNLSTAPNTSDIDYSAGVALGGPETMNGGNGLILIYWIP